MELIHSDSKYNYWVGWTDSICSWARWSSGTAYRYSKGFGYYYNVLPKWITNPNAGYPNSDYICGVKGVPNIFKQKGY